MRYGADEVTKAVGIFPTGASVTISILNLETDLFMSLTANVMTESAVSAGVFIWDTSNIITAPVTPTSILAIMSDGTNETRAKMTIGGSATDIADSVWNEDLGGYNVSNSSSEVLSYNKYISKSVFLDSEALTNGDGTQKSPFNNLNDAIDLAESELIHDITVYSDVILTRNLKNLAISGIGLPEIDLGGFDLKGSEFHRVKIKGQYTSPIIVQESVLLTGMYLNGNFENCALAGDLTCVDGGEVLIKSCASSIAGLGRPTISLNEVGTSKLSVRDNSGGLTLKDVNNTLDEVTVELNTGSLTLDSSCTAGQIVTRGLGNFVDNSTGSTVTNETINQEIIADVVWDEDTSTHNVSGSFGELVGKKLLTLAKWIGLR